jgi:hypothetical protein
MIIDAILFVFWAICIVAFCLLGTYIVALTFEAFYKMLSGDSDE